MLEYLRKEMVVISYYDVQKVLKLYNTAIDNCHEIPQPLLNCSEDYTEEYYSDRLKMYLSATEHNGKYGTILDLGCGCGNPIALMEPEKIAQLDYTGYDMNANMIRIAQKRFNEYPNLKFEHHDITFVPEKHYDIVLATESLVYFFDTDILLKFIKQYIDIADKIFYATLINDASIYPKTLNLSQYDIGRVIGTICETYRDVIIDKGCLPNKTMISVFKKQPRRFKIRLLPQEEI